MIDGTGLPRKEKEKEIWPMSKCELVKMEELERRYLEEVEMFERMCVGG